MCGTKFKLKHKFISEHYKSVINIEITNDSLFEKIVVQFEKNFFNAIYNDNYLFSKTNISMLIDLEDIKVKTDLISDEDVKTLIKKDFCKLYDNSELVVEYDDLFNKNDKKIIDFILHKNTIAVTYNMDIKTSPITKTSLFHDEKYTIDDITLVFNYDNLGFITDFIPDLTSEFKIDINKDLNDEYMDILTMYKEYLASNDYYDIEKLFYDYISPFIKQALFDELCQIFSIYISKYILYNIFLFDEETNYFYKNRNYDIVMTPIKVRNSFIDNILKFKISERSGLIYDTEISIPFDSVKSGSGLNLFYNFLDDDIEKCVMNSKISSMFKNMNILDIKKELVDILKYQLKTDSVRKVFDMDNYVDDYLDYYLDDVDAVCDVEDVDLKRLEVFNEVVKDGGFIIYCCINYYDDNCFPNVDFNIKNPIISDFVNEYIDSKLEFQFEYDPQFYNEDSLIDYTDLNIFLYEQICEYAEDDIGSFLYDNIVLVY